MKTVIVIGSGRSGSTLLSKMLDAHPRISFHGETDFLVPRLWNEIWENRFWFHWELQTNSNATSAISHKDNRTFVNLRNESYVDIPAELLHEAHEKVARSVHQTLKILFRMRKKDVLVWGFKEPWNGSSSFHYDWSIYDNVFPDAVWIHLMRNPFDHVRSVCLWNRTSLDIERLTASLKEWIKITHFSRTRKETGRLFEMTYENLVESPKATLNDIFTACEIVWDDRCLAPLETLIMRSRTDIPCVGYSNLTTAQVHEIYAKVPGLRELCIELDYELTADIPNYFFELSSQSKAVALSAETQKPSLYTKDFRTEIEWRQARLRELEAKYECVETELQTTQVRLQDVEAELARYTSWRLIRLLVHYLTRG